MQHSSPFYCFLIGCAVSGYTICSSKKVNCKPFQEIVFLKWFPDKPVASRRFKNIETPYTHSCNTSRFDKSKAYEMTTGGFFANNINGCSASASIAGTIHDDPNPNFSIGYLVLQDGFTKRLSVYFWNSYWNAGSIAEETIFADSSNTATAITPAQNILFDNGASYTKLVTLTNDTMFNKDDGMNYKLFIAKDHSIVGFETYPSKQKWVLQ